jgi:hypothetical protein
MLRRVMGDTLFFSATKSYLNDPRFNYRSATTEDFQGVMEQFYGESLGWFFQQWIYGMGHPNYQYGWSYQQEGDQYIIDLTIKQIQKSYQAEEVFTMPLDIQIMTIPGPVRDTVQVWNDQRLQTYQFRTDKKPGSIVLDPDNWVLQLNERITDIADEDNSLPQSYQLEQNYPNPFNATTTIEFSLPDAENVSFDIYNIQGKHVARLLSEPMLAGEHKVVWDAGNISSGIYYYQIKAGNFNTVKKCLLLK